MIGFKIFLFLEIKYYLMIENKGCVNESMLSGR